MARSVSERQLRAAVSAAGPDRLFEVAWAPVTVPAAHGEPPVHQVFESLAAEGDPVGESYRRTHEALAAVQSWLTEHDSGVLVVVTRGQWRWPARTSPTCPARRCGGWCARRRPSTPDGSC
ncbi:erythronolide synthase, modules 3 and 4 domain protein [Mycobacterium avium subsp. avium 2285 (R)]|nr:erythronolide synthase, modules 3 and 4 domain protein [Mycobacterium avium subsp. avium 2285 (R)]